MLHTTPIDTSWTLYSANEEAWESMIDDCSRATSTIDLEQFIFVADDFGKRLINVCEERAKAGVKVRFLWDAAFSFSFFGASIIEELKAKGIELVYWKTLIPEYYKVPNWRSWFFRNHRRTLVIDNTVGYTGSICINDRMKNWRDTNLRITGPVVLEMSNAFERMWHRATKNKGRIPERTRARDPEFRYVTNYPAPGRRDIHHELIDAIRHARTHIYITTPYFVPTSRLVRVLKLAALRKVDVRIILPEISNHPTADMGAHSYFETLLSSGVRIFQYKGNNIHAKTIVIDGDWATVGSMNLDRVSLLYNFEANIISKNTRFAEELSAAFVRDTAETKEVNLVEWRNRFFLEKIPEKLVVIIRKFL